MLFIRGMPFTLLWCTYGVFGRDSGSGLLSLSPSFKGGLDVTMNGGLIYRPLCRWNYWCMKERKPCSMVGDIEVIIFMGTKFGGLSYYGIVDNHLVKYMFVLSKHDVGWGGYPLLSSLTFNSSISTWITQRWIFLINSCCHITPWSHPTNCMVKWIIHT